MSAPSTPNWLTQLIAEEGEARPMGVHEREALIGALEAAHAPLDLAAERQLQILADALDSADPLAPATEEELTEAAKLRDGLDSNPLVVSLRSTQTAHLPSPQLESRLRHEALRRMVQPNRSRNQRRASTIWGAFAVAAAAAIVVLARSNSPIEKFEASSPLSSLALSRSTDSLFDKPFDSSSPSERIDKIAQMRAKDLRRNRYAIWGLP